MSEKKRAKKDTVIREKRKPGVAVSALPMAGLVVILFCSIKFLGADPHIPMLAVSVLTMIYALFYLRFTWEELEDGMLESIKSAMPAVLILMMVGLVVGSWIASGVVPTMIYYGLKIIHPSFFLISTMIICSVVSVCIGSAWTAAATVGIALMGIGVSMGLPAHIIGGAVISGSYFGDKMSPLSDTTNLAPAVAGCTLSEHIQHMFYTTTPSYVISLVLFAVVNSRYGSHTVDQQAIQILAQGIEEQFHIHPALMLVPVLVIVMIVLKVPAFLSLFVGAVAASLCSAVFQGSALADVVEVLHYGYDSESGIEALDELLTRGGLDNMMWTVSMILCAMLFAGVMEKTGMIQTLTTALGRFTKSTGSLVLVTVVSAFGMNVVTGEQYLSIIVPGRMYKNLYEEKGLHPKNLSRAVEDGGTITSPLIPWNGCGAFLMATLGLAPWTYVPYCFFNLVNPVISVIFGCTGFSMAKTDGKAAQKEAG